jgi:hypothetical protein
VLHGHGSRLACGYSTVTRERDDKNRSYVNCNKPKRAASPENLLGRYAILINCSRLWSVVLLRGVVACSAVFRARRSRAPRPLRCGAVAVAL